MGDVMPSRRCLFAAFGAIKVSSPCGYSVHVPAQMCDLDAFGPKLERPRGPSGGIQPHDQVPASGAGSPGRQFALHEIGETGGLTAENPTKHVGISDQAVRIV